MLHRIVWALLLTAPLRANDDAVDRLLDRIIEREANFLAQLRLSSPIMETYIQEQFDNGEAPRNDHYFLGRASLTSEIGYEAFQSLDVKKPRGRAITFRPRGFAQMMVPDATSFHREMYQFEFVRREFLGEIRCLVFDVAPRTPGAQGRFVGRIWVEDREHSMVRFNGSYTPAKTSRWNAGAELYFSFDSWRVNVRPGRWVPGYVYVEEKGLAAKNQPNIPRFKAQTRFWGYDPAANGKHSELTSILIESESSVADDAATRQNSPIESQRLWERQAEDNIVERLSKAGLLAPPGEVDKVLNTVVSNLIATNDLNVDVQCRVLMTTPLETFSIGRAIVISRGLIDVLPDEASLAMVLAGELAHIALGHRTETQYAFSNRTMLTDAQVLERFRFERPAAESAEAGRKTIEYLRNSPYQDKLGNAGLFLQALASRGAKLPHLVQANLGNEFGGGEMLGRLSELAQAAPALAEGTVEQIAALPLGSRVRVDPYSNQIALMKARPVALLSAREKLPFEVTPFVIHLTRAAQNSVRQATR